jgi:hypothetical protein
MSRSAFFHHPRRVRTRENGTLAALVIAILFVLLAAVSFAVDRSLPLPSQPLPPARSLQIPR